MGGKPAATTAAANDIKRESGGGKTKVRVKLAGARKYGSIYRVQEDG